MKNIEGNNHKNLTPGNVNKKLDFKNRELIVMKGDIEDGIECIDKCKWMIIGTCTVFLTLLSWDIVGDKESWNKSYWTLFVGLGIITILWIIDYLNCIKKNKGRISFN